MTLRIDSINFVAGLGAHEGKPLRPSDLLAMRLARKFHPEAEIFLHTSDAAGTCDNYREAHVGVRRVRYFSGDLHVPGLSGVQMSDLLRLQVMTKTSSAHALYLDTDAYCVQNLDFLAMIEGCAMARLSPYMIANGLIYTGPDRTFLNAWTNELAKLIKAGSKPCTETQWSCRLPNDLSLRKPGLTVLDCAKFHGATGDQAMQGFWVEQGTGGGTSWRLRNMISDSYVIHTMTPRPAIDSPGYGETRYACMLSLLEDLCM